MTTENDNQAGESMKNRMINHDGGISVQTGSLHGNVNINNFPPPTDSVHAAGKAGGAQRSRYYFEAGRQLGNRIDMLPYSERGSAGFEDFLAATKRTGLDPALLSPLVETGKRIAATQPGAEQPSLISLHASLVDQVENELEHRADQDELTWLTLGRLLYRTTGFRVQEFHFAVSESADLHAVASEARSSWMTAKADLEMLIDEADIPAEARNLFRRFATEFESLDSVEAQWASGEVLFRRVLRLLSVTPAR
ncbi:hypothetical protein [Amycolatopsis samaneae]|uniref:Uncharacterized protein n=1 Tax=Amycolatopsis samaneae TaxID=664691 RepID=A0ABW5GUW8_9PSEU